jgi:hypothetical protein
MSGKQDFVRFVRRHQSRYLIKHGLRCCSSDWVSAELLYILSSLTRRLFEIRGGLWLSAALMGNWQGSVGLAETRHLSEVTKVQSVQYPE